VLLPPAAKVNAPPVAALHPGTEKLIWGYRDLDTTQVLTHAGSGLTNIQEIGAFVVVEPSTVVTLPITYELDSSVIRRVSTGRYNYRLMLSKQPGIDDDLVDVRIELPAGASVIARFPASIEVAGDFARWSGVLLADTELVVEFEVQ